LCASACLGVTQRYTGDIFLIEDGDKLFETVALHEVGHVLLGGQHSSTKKDLMYPTVEGPKQISADESMIMQVLYCKLTDKDIERITKGISNGK